MLEFDTTHNMFRDELLTVPLDIHRQVAASNGTVDLPEGPGIGVTPDSISLKNLACMIEVHQCWGFLCCS